MLVKPKEILDLLKEAAAEWSDDNAARLGAALAYYSIFSLAPLLIIVVAVISAVWAGQSADLQARIVEELQRLIGPEGATAVEGMLQNASRPGAGSTLAAVLGVVALIFGATGVFVQLQGALNTVWDVRPKPGGGLTNFARTRLLSFGMILGVGFLLLVFLIVSAIVSAIGSFAQARATAFGEVIGDFWFAEVLAGFSPGLQFLFRVLDIVISLGVITLLFALIYRVLPDVKIAWRDVWFGAAVTAGLFVLGKILLGLYLGNTSAASAYGAAGSLVLLLLWIYYSAQIFFFGAELTQVWAKRYGSRIRPSSRSFLISSEPFEPAPAPSPALPARAPRAAPMPQPSVLKRAGVVLLAFLVGRFFGRRG